MHGEAPLRSLETQEEMFIITENKVLGMQAAHGWLSLDFSNCHWVQVRWLAMGVKMQQMLSVWGMGLRTFFGGFFLDFLSVLWSRGG
jgi:hypothetical protein